MWGSILRLLLPVLGGWVGSDLADLFKRKGNVPTVPEMKETFGGNLAKYGIIAGAVFLLGILAYTFIKEKPKR